jgi:tRNA 2-thiouridine synthesizing protein A
MNRKNKSADYFIDITQEVCPMTFVKTRLQIEKMNSGEMLVIRLLGDEPLKNVPDSLTELGHRVIRIERERQDADLYTLIIEKK